MSARNEIYTQQLSMHTSVDICRPKVHETWQVEPHGRLETLADGLLTVSDVVSSRSLQSGPLPPAMSGILFSYRAAASPIS